MPIKFDEELMRVSMMLPVDDIGWVDACAKRYGMTRAEVVRRIIKKAREDGTMDTAWVDSLTQDERERLMEYLKTR